MSHFFLHNRALQSSNYSEFKSGINQLIEIKRKDTHTFYRHDTCYNLPYFISDIFPNCNLPEERALLEFFEKLNSCCQLIECESTAKQYCKSDQNGFLGIDFTSLLIATHKQIVDDKSYTSWIYYYQSNYDRLTALFADHKIAEKFKKEFLNFVPEVQMSIIEKFEEALNRDFFNFPDNKLIKNVSVSNDCTVLELRVFHPISLRVYFNFINDKMYIATVEQKSNPNQNEDIKKAEKLLIYMNK